MHTARWIWWSQTGIVLSVPNAYDRYSTDIACLYICKGMPFLCFYYLLLPAPIQQHGVKVDLKRLILQRDSTSTRTCKAGWHFKTRCCPFGEYPSHISMSWGILLLTFTEKYFELYWQRQEAPSANSHACHLHLCNRTGRARAALAPQVETMLVVTIVGLICVLRE